MWDVLGACARVCTVLRTLRTRPTRPTMPTVRTRHAHPARRHRGSRNMQARRASGARSACHGWSPAGLARICALSSRSSRHQPSDPHKATLQACCRAACHIDTVDAFYAPSIAAPPSAAPSLFELEPTRAASSRTTRAPLNPGGCSPVARGVRRIPPIRLYRMRSHGARCAEMVTEARHAQDARHRTAPLCGGSCCGLGRAEQRTIFGDQRRHKEAMVVDASQLVTNPDVHRHGRNHPEP